jgi:hypothetical protein
MKRGTIKKEEEKLERKMIWKYEKWVDDIWE